MKAHSKLRPMVLFSSILLILFNINDAEASYIAKPNKATIQITPEAGYYKYEEPNIMQLKGPLIALSSEFFMPISNGFYFRLFLRGAYNFGDYSSNGSGTQDNDNSWFVNISPTIAYQFSFKIKMSLIPYIGIGYRYLNNDSSGEFTTTGHYSYLRESNYIYLPIGLNYIIGTHNSWAYRFQIEYDQLIRGYQYSHLRSSDGGTIQNIQTKGYGLNAKIEFATKISHTTTFGFGPYIYYWSIPNSEGSQFGNVTYIEPKNNTIDAGLFINFTF